jgi:hypothetical protein
VFVPRLRMRRRIRRRRRRRRPPEFVSGPSDAESAGTVKVSFIFLTSSFD